eukprot:gnl/TRDRNA2_/TRDRNA2_177388_c1_seq1.p1 gnl/TRDRNA2_/TRDRNA2_177388_c1~~gnl/TRDRNA2_/TRDRNA2_177388_c1_seq1.p1  ORF type:complete len:374 (-),score=-10.92 gnl/TRDRNA2_/TRDRNA2_177388_c1_seq1:931-2052(-)
MGTIKFRFKRSLVFDTITFTGQNICVSEIKSIICSRYNISAEEHGKILLVDHKSNVMKDDSQRVASGLKLIICQETAKTPNEKENEQKKINIKQKLAIDHKQHKLAGQSFIKRKMAIWSPLSGLESSSRSEIIKYRLNNSLRDTSYEVNDQRKRSVNNKDSQKKITNIMTTENERVLYNKDIQKNSEEKNQNYVFETQSIQDTFPFTTLSLPRIHFDLIVYAFGTPEPLDSDSFLRLKNEISFRRKLEQYPNKIKRKSFNFFPTYDYYSIRDANFEKSSLKENDLKRFYRSYNTCNDDSIDPKISEVKPEKNKIRTFPQKNLWKSSYKKILNSKKKISFNPIPLLIFFILAETFLKSKAIYSNQDQQLSSTRI